MRRYIRPSVLFLILVLLPFSFSSPCLIFVVIWLHSSNSNAILFIISLSSWHFVHSWVILQGQTEPVFISLLWNSYCPDTLAISPWWQMGFPDRLGGLQGGIGRHMKVFSCLFCIVWELPGGFWRTMSVIWWWKLELQRWCDIGSYFSSSQEVNIWRITMFSFKKDIPQYCDVRTVTRLSDFLYLVGTFYSNDSLCRVE